jgi:NAD(P)-dependent dehydrogenase (short-subunit alcohol dehydrogenase family)
VRLPFLVAKFKIYRCLIVVNNAGIFGWPYELTPVGLFLRLSFFVSLPFAPKDGIEAQFQTNHLGHFAFTIPLIPLLVKTSQVYDPSIFV